MQRELRVRQTELGDLDALGLTIGDWRNFPQMLPYGIGGAVKGTHRHA